jgi:hypothetical protein
MSKKGLSPMLTFFLIFLGIFMVAIAVLIYWTLTS